MQRTISFAKVKQTNTKNRTRPDKRIISWLNLNSGESLLSTNEKKNNNHKKNVCVCVGMNEWMNKKQIKGKKENLYKILFRNREGDNSNVATFRQNQIYE